MGALLGEAARIVDAAVGSAGAGDDATGLDLAGIGWATVELDRAARELADAGVVPATVASFEPARADPFLGAGSLVALSEVGLRIVLLEPDTEGRLAAYLARHGEGVAVAYVRDGARWAAGGSPARAPAPERHGHEAAATHLIDGPLGPQRPLAGGRDGPWLILVGAGRESSRASRGHGRMRP
jgi:hypothetical protein